MSQTTTVVKELSKATLRHGITYLAKFLRERKYVLYAIIFGGTGGLIGTAALCKIIISRYTRRYLLTTSKQDGNQRARRRSIGVNPLFLHRLWSLIKICIPSWKSSEFGHLVTLTALLVVRTLLSIKVADITGKNAQYLVERRWSDTIRGILIFAAFGVPASCINSALRYETDTLALKFRKRLTEKLHREYINGLNYYKASYLGRIDTADQRMTSDIVKFTDQLSSLYTTLFKPIMDIILVTHKLNGVVGKIGPMVLFLYYVLAGLIKRYVMPSFGQLAVRESELEGQFRSIHQRLISNAEEIAFYDGSKKEQTIANKLFNILFRHESFVNWLKAFVGVFDNFLIKYGTSITGYVILSLPVYFPPRGVLDPGTTAELTMAFVRNRQLLINLSTAIGQLLMLSNKITSLAGITARVSELFEMVRSLDEVGVKPFPIRSDDERGYHSDKELDDNIQLWLKEWKSRGEQLKNSQPPKSPTQPRLNSRKEGGQIIEGKFIRFENVNIVSPDGKLLVEDLTFEVTQHQNVMVTGPNGSGKSSLFRILGELWPLHSGTVVKPRKEDILFIPQKPYLVQGTLRDQIIYPHSVEDMLKNNVTDEDILHLLSLADPNKAILGEYRLDDQRDWFNIFSGGQKQRVALARLFYHRPLFAILDECTSQVNEDVEAKTYETCKQLGITLFTVSHRPYLQKYHDAILTFDGRGNWEWKNVDKKVDLRRSR